MSITNSERKGEVTKYTNKSGKVSSDQSNVSSRINAHGDGETEWWFDCRTITNTDIKVAVEQSSCTSLLVMPTQLKDLTSVKKLVVWVNGETDLQELDDDISILTPSLPVYKIAKSSGRQVGLYIKVKDLESEFINCIDLCQQGDDYIVIDIEHATYIPYELLIAKVQNKKTKVYRSIPISDLEGVIDYSDQSLNAFATMEHGIGVLFRSESIKEINELSNKASSRQASTINLVAAEVIEVKHTGLGHRVCIDTTSLMNAEEGMIIGSTGWGGIFVCSETHYLPHMNLREFRVNAGAVHSYVWAPDNSTVYLSEMQAGTEVTCVDAKGNTRVVTVGRAKIERRPMINIKCRVSLDQVSINVKNAIDTLHAMQENVTPANEKISSYDLNYVYINAFLQNDWHVRVMGADGKVKHSSMLVPGDHIFAHVDIPGRHVGIKIAEHILEK